MQSQPNYNENPFVRLVRMVRYWYPGEWEKDMDIAKFFDKTPSSVTRWKEGENDHWKREIERVIAAFPLAYDDYTGNSEATQRGVTEVERENADLRKKVGDLEEKIKDLNGQLADERESRKNNEILTMHFKQEQEKLLNEIEKLVEEIKELKSRPS